MKTLMIALFLFSVPCYAKSYVPKKMDTANLQKNMKFGDHRVNGKFMFSQEAIATVENEKSLSELLGLRKHFKDRLEDLSKRY